MKSTARPKASFEIAPVACPQPPRPMDSTRSLIIALAAVALFLQALPFYLMLGEVNKNPTLTVYTSFYAYEKLLLLFSLIGIALIDITKVKEAISDNIYMMFIFIFYVISMAWAADPYLSFRSLVQLAPSFLFCFVCVAYLSARDCSLTIMHALGIILICSVVVVLVFPFYGVHAVDDMVQEGHEGSWRGILVHKNQLGAIAGMALPFFIAARRTVPFWLMSIYLLCAILCVIGAKSSTGYVLAVSGTVLSGVLSIRSRMMRRRMIVIIAALLLIAALVGEQLAAFVLDLLGKDATFSGRIYLWQAAWELIWESPILGHGYPSTSDVAVIDRFINTYNAANAHNAYLQLMVESGFVGFSLWSMAMGLSALALSRTLDLPEIPPECAALGTLFVAGLIQNMSEISAIQAESTLLGQIWILSMIALTGYYAPRSRR